jgi:hypothetical protein
VSFEDVDWHVNDDIWLSRFYCQGCQNLFSVTLGRPEKPALNQFELFSETAQRSRTSDSPVSPSVPNAVTRRMWQNGTSILMSAPYWS